MISVGAAAPARGTLAGKPPTATPTTSGPTPTPTSSGGAANVTITNSLIGQTATSIGAVEACTRFNIAELLDLGVKNYRVYADLARFEGVDDDGMYGSPTIAQIKANPNIIPWAMWDTQFDRTDAYFFEPGCAPLGTSNKSILTQLKANGIRPILGMRPIDNKGNPAWATSMNPPTTQADWNEWWEYVFGLVYTINVRYNLDINDWEVHNEPDNTGQGWGGTLADYIVFTQQTHDAIKYVYDTYLPGKTFRLYAPVSTHNNTWIDTTLQQNDAIVDVIDWHRYGPTVDDATSIHNKIVTYNTDGVLEALHLSEWGTYRGYSGDGTGYGTWMLTFSQPASKIDYSSIFSMYDWGTCCPGIVSATGTKTPTYYALRLVIRGTQGAKDIYQINTSLSPAMLAAKDPATGKLYYTITNTAMGAQNASVTLDVSAHFTTGTATFYQDDGVTFFDAQTGTASLVNGRVSFTVPKNTIMQVVVP